MKLSHPLLEGSIEFFENKHNILIIKNKSLLYTLLEELQMQCTGEDGRFLLISEGNRLVISKKIFFYSDVINIDCNEKKILTKYYKSLEQIYNMSNEIINLSDINAKVIKLINIIAGDSESDISHKLDLNFIELLKLYEVKINTKGLKMYDKIHKIIDICSRLNICDIIIFVNLKLFLTEEELENIYKFSAYMKMNLLLVEIFEAKKIDGEIIHIIDDELCEITKQ